MKQATFIQIGTVFQPAIADERGIVMPLKSRDGRPICHATADAARDQANRIVEDARHARKTALVMLAALFTACSGILVLEGASPVAVLICGVFAIVAADYMVVLWRAVLSVRP